MAVRDGEAPRVVADEHHVIGVTHDLQRDARGMLDALERGDRNRRGASRRA